MGTENHKEDRNTPEYLAQLLKDKKQIAAFPNVFIHTERLLDEEINKVRSNLFHLSTNKEPLNLPAPVGNVEQFSEKLYVPVKDYPEFNFVGRILGPRGMTAKQLEQDTGCKIMVRGKGSMRDRKKEEMNRGKPNWEHLNEDLHVLITVEDTKNRAMVKLERAKEEVKKLLVPAPEGEDDLKKMQLMELAILNGTFRQGQPTAHLAKLPAALAQGHRMLAPGSLLPHCTMRSPTPQGPPIILAAGARLPATMSPTMSTSTLLSSCPPLVSPTEGCQPMLYQYDPYSLAMAAGASPLLEYPAAMDHSAAGAVNKLRRAVGVREHPYTRVSLA
jgi:protein quaking